MRSPEVKVLYVAVVSRLLLLTLIPLWRLVFDPYDTSAALNPSCLSSSVASPPPKPVLWPRVGEAIERSVVWDGVYFVRIAECGYEYEQSYAFFPLLPVAMALASRSVLAPLVPLFGYRAVLALAGYVINNVAFVLAAVYFYRLSFLTLKDSGAAMRASILFCFNPASIFYSSIYSESLYALFSLGGLFYLFSGSYAVPALLLTLTGSARSNGMINAGYFCFQAMIRVYDAIIWKKNTILAVRVIVAEALRVIFVILPFLVFQTYGYFNLCLGRNSDEPRPWCKARFPHLYGYIQNHYWGVGFLRYFQVKQLPNFLLASPILSVAVWSIIHYAALLPEVVQSLRMQTVTTSAPLLKPPGTSQHVDDICTLKDVTYSNSVAGDPMIRRRKQHDKVNLSNSSRGWKPTNLEALLQAKQGYVSIMVLPFVLHLGFMASTAFFVMHVQVATRFLSASPSIYWFASYAITSSRRFCYLICVYSVAYILLGSLLFSNFYPFT